MTTTAHEDQFTAAILRQNVADLEMELQRQKERHAAATARLRDQIERVTSEWERAEAALASAREDLQSWIDSRNGWMERAHAAEAELKAAREQEPALFVSFCDDDTIRFWSTDRPKKSRFPIREFYNRPIPKERSDSTPAPVVDVGAGKLAANAADTKHPSHVTRSSDSSSYDEKCVNCGATDISGGGWGELAKPCQAPVMSVEWRDVMAELAADLQASIEAEHAYRNQYSSIMRKYQNDMRIVERARALLQSAEVRHDDAATDRLLEGGE